MLFVWAKSLKYPRSVIMDFSAHSLGWMLIKFNIFFKLKIYPIKMNPSRRYPETNPRVFYAPSFPKRYRRRTSWKAFTPSPTIRRSGWRKAPTKPVFWWQSIVPSVLLPVSGGEVALSWIKKNFSEVSYSVANNKSAK